MPPAGNTDPHRRRHRIRHDRACGKPPVASRLL